MSYSRSILAWDEEASWSPAGSRLAFRGAERAGVAADIACIGGSATWGVCVRQPFAQLLERMTGWSCVNLGVRNAGVDTFLGDPATLALAAAARVVVLEVLPLPNLSNPCYIVHPRRNDRFLAPRSPLARLFPEVDFMRINFCGHLVRRLREVDERRFERVARIVARSWVARMRDLTERVGGRVVLLHLAPGPGPKGARLEPWAGLLDRVGAASIVTVRRTGTLEPPRAASAPNSDPRFHLPGPVDHHLVAEALARAIRPALAPRQ